MTSASWALQQAVFATLVMNGDVHDSVGDRVYDAVPRGAAFPYLVVGEGAESDASAAGGTGREHTLEIHAWSRAGGCREIKLAAAAVCDALDGILLELDGHTLVDLAFVSADYARESDGETYRATLRFRAVTEPE
jgi:hypothetical protein